MKFSIMASMILTAMALSSMTFAAPVNSTSSDPTIVSESSFLMKDLTMQSILTNLPFVGNSLEHVAAVLVSIGLNDPKKIASMSDEQKSALQKLQDAISNAADNVASTLPVNPKQRRGELRTKWFKRDSEPISPRQFGGIGGLSKFGELFDEESGTLEPQFQNGKYLVERQFGGIGGLSDFGELFDEESGTLEPQPQNGKYLEKRQFGGIGGLSDFGKLFDEESGTLEPQAQNGKYLKRSTPVPVSPPSLPADMAAPTGALPDDLPPLFSAGTGAEDFVTSAAGTIPTGIASSL